MNKISALIVFLLVATYSFAQKADDIVGKYHLPNNLDVEIFKMNNKYYGKIIALNEYENGQTKDIKNRDKSKHNDPLLEKIIIKDLEFDSENKEWINGSMYGPEKGMVFNLKITEIRKNEIVVVGSKFIMWRTLVWKKI